jgi:origin recognition complex subunit 1
MNKGCSSSLYISGMPGTGKTATTLEIIKKLKNNKSMPFDFLHINAMSLTNPNLVYTVICENITRKRVNPASAAAFLDEFFKKRDKTKVLSNFLSKRGYKNTK